MSKNNCHTGNPLVFEAQGVKVYAGGNTRNGGWMQMDPKPDLAIGPQGVIRTARTLDKFPMGWACGSKVTTKKTPLLIELEWPDYSIPTNVGRDFWVQLVEDIKTNDIKSVSTQCMGGHGRTGVQLCILAHLMIPQDQHTWKDAGELIQHIRDVYCQHAVEAPSQQKYIADVLGIPSGQDKVAIQSMSTTTASLWDDVDFKFDPDDIELEEERPRRKRRKGRGKGKKTTLKSYTNGKKKKFSGPAGLIHGHTLYQCERCEDYEFRGNTCDDTTCDVCGTGELVRAEDSLHDKTGDRSAKCRSCYHEYHPLEMQTQTQCKACFLSETNQKALVVNGRDGLKHRKFICDETGQQYPLVFARISKNGRCVADIKDEPKGFTLDSYTYNDKTATAIEETIDKLALEQALAEAMLTKDLRLIDTIEMRLEELEDLI